MGRKRKNEDSEEEIKRKIRKWERKLREKAKNRRIIYSSDEGSNSQLEASPLAIRGQTTPPPTMLLPPPSPRGPSPVPSPRAQSPRAQSPRAQSPRVPSPRAPSPSPVTTDQIACAEEEIELEGDILQLLGDTPKSDTPLGPPIHKDVASRWQEILAKGLVKEVKDKIFEEYLVPSNCDFLTAPTLNPEAKAALSDPLVKRDNFLMQKQKQLGIALSALASATSLILSNETSKQRFLKPISDACRILCDNHYIDTKSRRNLVISSTNKDTLIELVRDKSWLFGENISEKLKVAKTIQRSGDDLKNQPKPTPRPTYQGKNNRGRFLYNPQHRKTDNKPTTSSISGRGRQPARAPPRATQRITHRSPPPPRRSTHK